MTLSYIHR